MKKAGFILLIVIIVILVLQILFFVYIMTRGAYFDPDLIEYPVPESGKWSNQELNLVLSFGERDSHSTIVINGREIECVVAHERFGPDIFVSCLRWDDPEYSQSDILFSGVLTDLSEEQFTVIEHDTDKAYIFNRIDE